jgi:plastocyanin
VVVQTATPVPSAAVVLIATGQTSRNATTGTTGVYTFSNVPVGSWTATVTAPTGYTGSGTASVTVVGGQQANAAAVTLTKTAGGGNPAPATANVSMENTAFLPSAVEVRVGGTVTWTNNDAVQHNATGGSGLATGNMNQGQSRSHIFNTAGTFNYSCTLHAGMTGQVTVR